MRSEPDVSLVGKAVDIDPFSLQCSTICDYADNCVSFADDDSQDLMQLRYLVRPSPLLWPCCREGAGSPPSRRPCKVGLRAKVEASKRPGRYSSASWHRIKNMRSASCERTSGTSREVRRIADEVILYV